ncbi:MAG: TonB-dependent receptor [Deltaproteobacteria bacterium]|nr:MAG: TonB-dependent receptor [Deltaproteobacteria bacterium]
MSRVARWALAPVLTALLVLSTGGGASADGMPTPDVLDADDPTVTDDLGFGSVDLTASGPSDEDLVLAAQKRRTTVQEAPSIIYVITRRQIQERGYRTLNEVLRTVPGFEGDRWEGNGWQKESFARGIPRGVLVLLNGVNIDEPLRSFVSLDRKIPLEIVDRVEVTSGPGGVLWGSNALLGIVNIVTRRPDGHGVQLLAGAGDGPGDRLATKVALGIDEELSEDIALFAHVSFFTSNGPELTLDAQKVLGSLPAPADDSPTFYIPEQGTFSSGERDYFFNFAGRLELGPVALDWMLPFTKTHRALATGGAPLVTDFIDPSRSGTASASADAVRVVQLSWADRFADGAVGVLARAHVTQWEVDDDPFGVYPSSPIVLANLGYSEDLRLTLKSDVLLRPGASVDFDIHPSETLTLLAGLDLAFDISSGIKQRSWTTDTLGTCPEGFVYDATDIHLPCHIDDPLVEDVTRSIGGGFVQADWRVLPELALSAGLRLQASSQFDPALLWSGGVVWGPTADTHFKLFAASGLRPPGILSTHVLNTTAAISFDANPALDAETSRSIEVEANTTLLRDSGVVRDLYLRANGSLTQMRNVIVNSGGRFANSGEQRIWAAEGFARLRFQRGHELWANYSFTKVLDDAAEGGELQNIARHMANFGGKVGFLDDHIELTGLLTWKGSMVDPNRPPLVDPSRPDYSVSCADLLAAGTSTDNPLAAVCSFPSLQQGVWVMSGASVRETLEPVLLLDLGVRFKNIWRDLTVAIFVHNVLDARYYEPDLFNDARVLSRPQPKPGMSFFGQVSFGL